MLRFPEYTTMLSLALLNVMLATPSSLQSKLLIIFVVINHTGSQQD